jgi:hypothetical protein
MFNTPNPSKLRVAVVLEQDTHSPPNPRFAGSIMQIHSLFFIVVSSNTEIDEVSCSVSQNIEQNDKPPSTSGNKSSAFFPDDKDTTLHSIDIEKKSDKFI